MERERERGMERQIDRFIGEKRKKERQIERLHYLRDKERKIAMAKKRKRKK